MPGPCDNPIAIRFFMSSNLTVQGQRIKDSPQFNFRFDKCKNVHVESVHITAPALSPNTDWIHIENNNGLQIYNSVISNGDDCESIGSGCYNVDIKNITCGPGHGISDSVPCTNLTLSDVELLPCQGILMKDPFCWNAYGDLQTLTIPPVSCLMEGILRFLLDSDIEHR